MSDIWHIGYWSGGLWPYMALVLFGFLPSEFWRLLSVFVARGIDPNSQVLEWVRAVSTALLAAVIAKIIFVAPGALGEVPLALRIGAMGVGLAVYLVMRRSVIFGVAAGVAATILAAWYFAGPG